MSLLAELKRRNVLRVAAAYLVVAWLVIQVVETILPAFGYGPAVVRLTTLLAAIGFVPAVVLAWVFQVTPEGIRRDTGLDDGLPPPNPRAARSLDRIILVLLALALTYFALDKFVLGTGRGPQQGTQPAPAAGDAQPAGRQESAVHEASDKSIAVLAFGDMSEGRDQEYLSDGIAEELLNLLSRIPDLHVTSRQSAFSFKGKDVLVTEVARELKVAHVLQGSVRKSGDRLRITAQLVDARSDRQLWSESFDRELGDIFAIQEEIAAAVVAQLKVRLLGEPPRIATTHPEAYSLGLQGRYYANLGSAEGYAKAVELLQQALAIDPDYAGAWVGLSSTYSNQASNGTRPRDEGFALSQEAAERALAIDPHMASAHARLGWIAMAYHNDLESAARHLKHALDLDPVSMTALSNAATLLRNLGRIEQATKLLEYIRARDPVVPSIHYNIGYYFLALGRWDDAIEAYGTALRLSPGRFGAHHFAGVALLHKGEFVAAMEQFEREPQPTLLLLGRVLGLHALGDSAGADAVFAQLAERYGEEWAYYIAGVQAYRGDADQAFGWLARSAEGGRQGLSGIASNPLFAGLRDDPRWIPFLESVGLAPSQLDAIDFEVPAPW